MATELGAGAVDSPASRAAARCRLQVAGERVATGLFPAARPFPSPWYVVLAAYLAAAAAGAVVLLWWGAGAMRPAGRLWAEDGSIFLSAAHAKSFGGAFFTPYAGYLHSVPRLIAGLSTLFPLQDAARLFAIASVATRVGVALFVFRASSGVLRSVTVRAGLAATVVLLPVGGLETLDNIANLHWFLAVAAFFALLWRPTRWWECALAALVVLLAMTSDPGVGLFAPLALLRLLALRRWRDHLVTAAFAAGAAAQLITVLGASRGPHQSFGAGEIARFYGYRVVVGTLGGFRHTHWLATHWGGFAIALAAAVMLALLTPALLSKSPRRWFAVSCVVFATAVFVLALRDPRVAPGSFVDAVTSVPRYDVVPSLLVLAALAASLDSVSVDAGRLRRSRTTWAALGLRLAVALAFLSALPADLAASHAYWNRSIWNGVPSWPGALSDAAARCETTQDRTINVAILPLGWHSTLPCRDVVADAGNRGAVGENGPASATLAPGQQPNSGSSRE
jgi:hypothetical protein